MTRIELINALIRHYRYSSYLEIGVNTPAQPGWSHDSITIDTKHGVDPNPEVRATFPVPSDEFFGQHVKQKYDIIFVDGLHLFEQAYRDIINSLHWLNDGGTIVVHDCNPIKEITQRRERASDAWHGDVWKAILKLRTEHPDVQIATVDTDEGCALIRRGKQELLETETSRDDIYTYNFFSHHRREILNLISVADFQRIFLSPIIIKLQGGLGNQFFQYALGRSLGIIKQVPVRYDLSWFNKQELRRLEIEDFNTHVIPATEHDLRAIGLDTFSKGVARLMRRLLGRRSNVYIDRGFPFLAEVFHVEAPAYFDGYWQSEKYFSNIASVLRREFQLRQPPEGKNASMLADILSQDAVALHIRREYNVEHDQTKKTHGVTSLAYYQAAMAYILARHPTSVLYIFSDDLTWVKDNLLTNAQTIFVDINSPDHGYEDLRLMAACQHHIIANSTFSWWGAWLAEHPGQIVIAPKQWFASPVMDDRDIVPERWLRM